MNSPSQQSSPPTQVVLPTVAEGRLLLQGITRYVWNERLSLNTALVVGNRNGLMHSLTNSASPGFMYCEDIVMPECKYYVLLSENSRLKVSQSLVYMDYQFCIPDTPSITQLHRSNYWDISTADPLWGWSGRTVAYASWDLYEERARLAPTTIEDNLYLHSIGDQVPEGRIKSFQASQRNIINKAE